MSTLRVLAVCAALGLTPAVAAQTNVGLAPPAQQGRSGVQDQGVVEVSNVVVAEIDSLPRPVRDEIDAKIAKTTENELRVLRHSLSAVPAATSALSAKGKSVKDVVAAALDPGGALLIVTTTEI